MAPVLTALVLHGVLLFNNCYCLTKLVKADMSCTIFLFITFSHIHNSQWPKALFSRHNQFYICVICTKIKVVIHVYDCKLLNYQLLNHNIIVPKNLNDKIMKLSF